MLTRKKTSLIGVRWPASSRNGGQLQIGSPAGFTSVRIRMMTPSIETAGRHHPVRATSVHLAGLNRNLHPHQRTKLRARAVIVRHHT
jgi:hypothetical protein